MVKPKCFFDLEKLRIEKTCIPARITGISPYNGNESIIYLSFIDNFLSIGLS